MVTPLSELYSTCIYTHDSRTESSYVVAIHLSKSELT